MNLSPLGRYVKGVCIFLIISLFSGVGLRFDGGIIVNEPPPNKDANEAPPKSIKTQKRGEKFLPLLSGCIYFSIESTTKA